VSKDKAVFKYESASVMVTAMEDHYWISHLYSIVPQKGHATELMTMVTQWADENQVTLILEARQYGNVHGLTTSQLKAFYEKFGFTGDAPRMTRNPASQEKHSL